MENIASWVATVATILAALMTASSLGARVTGIGFAIFTVGSVAWFTLGMVTDQPALIYTNIVMTGINLFGVWRWLGRQARIEEGARTAAQASEGTPGEALFPVSLLTSAPAVGGDGRQAGRCVEAMASCDSGRIAYVVVSEGGVAGVGESLRRLPWKHASVDGERLAVRLDANDFARLETVERDRWPDR